MLPLELDSLKMAVNDYHFTHGLWEEWAVDSQLAGRQARVRSYYSKENNW